MKYSIYFVVLDITITGGVERVASNFAHYFHEQDDYQFTILSVFKKNREPAYILPTSTNVMYLLEDKYYNSSSLYRKVLSNFLMLRAFNKLYFSKNDVVISNMAGCSDYLCLNRKKNRGRLICFEHTYHGVFNPISTIVKNILFKRADCIVTLTESEREYYANVAQNVHCIPNALTFPPSVEKPRVRKRIISAGRLSWEKGYENLLSIYSELANDYKDWEFVIYGSGELYDSLNLKVSKMPSNVKLFPSTQKLKDELQNSYLFVSSSITEAFPMVMLEAMACGLPVVSFDCPCGPREIIIDNLNGRLVPMGDNKSYIDAIKMFLNDPSIREQSSIMSTEIAKKFLPEVIYRRWTQLIESLFQ